MHDWHTGLPPTSTVYATQRSWCFPCVSGWCLRILSIQHPEASLVGLVVKNPPCSTGDLGSTSLVMGLRSYMLQSNQARNPNYWACMPWASVNTTREPEHHSERSGMMQQRSHLPQPRPEAAKERKRKKYFKSTAPHPYEMAWKAVYLLSLV